MGPGAAERAPMPGREDVPNFHDGVFGRVLSTWAPNPPGTEADCGPGLDVVRVQTALSVLRERVGWSFPALYKLARHGKRGGCRCIPMNGLGSRGFAAVLRWVRLRDVPDAPVLPVRPRKSSRGAESVLRG
jgi:hypothetical protein